VKNLTWQNPEQLFVAQVLIKKVKLKCCGIKVSYEFDEDFVKKKGLIRIDDNYTILDALDGEHDAYWNID